MKRYNVNIDGSDIFQGMIEDSNGEYVEYQDLEALKSRVREWIDYTRGKATLCDCMAKESFDGSERQRQNREQAVEFRRSAKEMERILKVYS